MRAALLAAALALALPSPSTARDPKSDPRGAERTGAKATDAARERESEARRRHQSEAAAQRLDSMHRPSVPKSEGERLHDQETLSRLRDEAERARRAADDEIPRLWRDRR
jgi:hypothetical protein